MHAMDAMLARAEPFACVMVLNTTGKLNHEHRKRVAKWNTDNAEALRQHCRGFAMVVGDSPVLRFVISSMLMLIRRPVPHSVFSTEAAAVVWVRERLRERVS